MKVDTKWVLGLLKHYLGQTAETGIRKKMNDHVGLIAAGMRSKGLDVDKSSVGVCSRDALFRLWRSVIPSGDISDLIRDAQAPQVVPAVELLFPHGAGALEAVVTETMNAALKQVFGG